MNYTLDSLKAFNKEKYSKLTITENELTHANNFLDALNASRNKEMPVPGDLILYTDVNGSFYRRALIEKIHKNGMYYICLGGAVPYAEANSVDGSVKLNIGTGVAFTSKDLMDRSNGSTLEKVGTDKQLFKELIRDKDRFFTFENFYFEGEVNVWRYTENPKITYSEEYYDRSFISYIDEKDSDYHYLVNGPRPTAFKDEEDYKAWVKTFCGTQIDGTWSNRFIVWSYKHEKIQVDTDTYNKIDGVVDTHLCNGLKECKRVYDHENKLVKTYYLNVNNKDCIDIKFPKHNIPNRAAYIELYGE